jgi:hypothetical protein
MIRADRVRKARRTTRCPLCGGPIFTGRQIARLGKTWVHSTCAAARQRDRGPPEPEPVGTDKTT